MKQAATPVKLRGYQQIIADATGETEPKVLAEIEDIMRHDVFHSTLDWQTREVLTEGARTANAVRKMPLEDRP